MLCTAGLQVDAGQAFTWESDMYAAGMLLLEMLTAKDPYAYLLEQATAATGGSSGSDSAAAETAGPASTAAGASTGAAAGKGPTLDKLAARNREYQRLKENAAQNLLEVPNSPFYGVSEKAKVFLKEALHKTPSSRPRTGAGKVHAYFTD